MADITTTKIWVDGEQGVTAAKMNQIISGSSIQPAFYTSKPIASTVNPTDIALIVQAGAYAQAPISTLGGAATQAQIWSTRLRSFNSVGNPSFEVDQRTVFAGTGFASTLPFCQDRWQAIKLGASAAGVTAIPNSGTVNIPGTSFAISAGFLRCTLTQVLGTLAAGDCIYLSQSIEGINLRELRNDVHSVSLLVRSSVANLNIGLGIRSASGTITSLSNLVSLGAANTWSIVTLQNLPVWSASGTWPTSPGTIGYYLTICLGAGSTFLSPVNGTWQTGTFIGAAGQSNFAASPVNSTVDIAFIQHEPGAVCSTFMDLPFQQNYSACLRYFQKSHPYGVSTGVGSTQGEIIAISPSVATPNIYHPVRFGTPLPISNPTVTIYASGTGAINNVLDSSGSINRVVSSVKNPGMTGFGGVVLATSPAATSVIEYNYTVDSGW